MRVRGWIRRAGVAVQAVAALVLAALALGAPPASAERVPRPQFVLPVDCAAVPCFLQNMVDRVDGPGVQDGWCGRASFDGHKGTDIRVSDMGVLQRGVAVRAVAAGTVRAVRDAMADRMTPTARDREAVRGRECGNGLVIDHGERWGGGWTTQLCHLARGSLTVRKGERVEAGQVVGRMGVSGSTQFPHVHLGVRHRGRIVDPMTGRSAARACLPSRPLDRSLWSEAARAAFPAGPEAVLAMGLASAPPGAEAVAAGTVGKPTGSEPVHAWVSLINVARGDRLVLTLTPPVGQGIERTTRPFDRSRAFQVLSSRPAIHRSGRWRIRLAWLRGETVLLTREVETVLR